MHASKSAFLGYKLIVFIYSFMHLKHELYLAFCARYNSLCKCWIEYQRREAKRTHKKKKELKKRKSEINIAFLDKREMKTMNN